MSELKADAVLQKDYIPNVDVILNAQTTEITGDETVKVSLVTYNKRRKTC